MVDYVRVPDKRNLNSKSYITFWNVELFKINEINSINPVTCGLEDKNNEQIKGKYYEQDLLRSVFNFESNQKLLESMPIFHKFVIHLNNKFTLINIGNSSI